MATNTNRDDTIRITVTEEPVERKPSPRLGPDRVVEAMNALLHRLNETDPQAVSLLDNIYSEITSERDRVEMARDMDRKRYQDNMRALNEMLTKAQADRDKAVRDYANADRCGREAAIDLLKQYISINMGLSVEDVSRYLNVLTGESDVPVPPLRMEEITEIAEDVARYVLEEEIYLADDEDSDEGIYDD